MRLFWGITVLLLSIQSAWLNAEDAGEMRVGVKSVPPFAMQNESGEWTGLSVDLWQSIALEQGWRTVWVPLATAEKQIDALAANEIDIAVGAL